MSDCAYSDPKLKKVHYHLHYKKDSAQALASQNFQSQQHVHVSSINKPTTQQVQVGTSQRVFDTGFIQVDTSQIETIDINHKLLAERDQLRFRIINLEEQLVTSLETQKIEIIRQLEQKYNEQLKELEITHSKSIELERSQMSSLRQQVTELSAQNITYKENITSLQKTLEKYEQKFEKFSEKSKKEKDQIKKSFQEDIEKLQNEILSLKEKVRDSALNNDRPTKVYFEEQLANVKAQLQLKVLRIEKLESDNQGLEQQLHQQALELSSLQTQLKIKSQDYDRYTIQRKTSDIEKQMVELQRQYEKTIFNLEEKIDHQKQKIQKLKLQISKGPIKLDPVIVDRPVQVETVVETVKYIPVVKQNKIKSLYFIDKNKKQRKEQQKSMDLIIRTLYCLLKTIKEQKKNQNQLNTMKIKQSNNLFQSLSFKEKQKPFQKYIHYNLRHKLLRINKFYKQMKQLKNINRKTTTSNRVYKTTNQIQIIQLRNLMSQTNSDNIQLFVFVYKLNLCQNTQKQFLFILTISKQLTFFKQMQNNCSKKLLIAKIFQINLISYKQIYQSTKIHEKFIFFCKADSKMQIQNEQIFLKNNIIIIKKDCSNIFLLILKIFQINLSNQKRIYQ
ncbi:hypothetical protein TTHERM_00136490 (macronuclear) [Tetrahymena thermophila SB210]|uniref:Uncharacterized protein n=1 Tax=Tetrahymena thermophila (strain SB210) TaxID=312017 RepID=I7M8Q8_TETTS|nr:hypothetical protein TTHERM_00136490 [Tetrahymena thermophila SB210]EAR99485.2 hypothetical protein TTHERM_00136490 [Tetrahymena thermophila SB210]|eukprot:XP_001019730.2 hypothetical protein TTHERM_00136490 [Tetrahymena thermophila SB210]